MNQVTLKYKISTDAICLLEKINDLPGKKINEFFKENSQNRCGLPLIEYQLAYWIALQRYYCKELQISFESKKIPIPLRSN